MTKQRVTSLTRTSATAPGTTDLIGSQAWNARRSRNAATRDDFDHDAALGYARFSTPGQREASIDRQLDGIRRAAAEQRVRLLEIYVDRGVSGTRSDRESLSAMLDFLRKSARRPAKVLIESADRLARDTRVFIDLWDELGKLGVTLHDVKNGLIDSALKAALVGAMAAQEWSGIRFRTRRGREMHAAQGRIMAGAGFGYRTVPGFPGVRVVHPVEAGHVRRMFKMRAAGMSIGLICKDMQDAGVPIEGGGGGGKWFRSTVSRILSNPIYKGVSAYNRTEEATDGLGRTTVRNRPLEEVIQAPVDHLRLVDVEVWDKVQTLSHQDAGTGAAVFATPPGGKYLLSGKVVCHGCGKPMMASTGGKADPKPRWRCRTRADGHGCGNKTSFYMDVVERHVYAALGEMLDRDDFEEHHFGSAARAIDEHNRLVHAQIGDVASRLDVADAKLRRSFEDGFSAGFSPERVGRFRADLERECAELQARQNELRRGLRGAHRNPAELLALRDIIPGLAGQAPFIPVDAPGHELMAALRAIIGPIGVTVGDAYGALDITVALDLVGDGSLVRLCRTHHLDWSDEKVTERNRQAEAAVEARTYAIDAQAWSELRRHLPGFLAVTKRRGEVMPRLLVEAVLVTAMTGATKSVVYRLMNKKWETEFGAYDNKVQAQGGFDQLEEALRQGHLPMVGRLNLSALRYHARPNRRKRLGRFG